MTIKIRKGAAVPIVISEITVKREPKTTRRTSYLGFFRGVKNLAASLKVKIAEIVHESFFEEEIDVEDPGIVEKRHFAIQIAADGGAHYLTVDEIPFKPACGHHYEIIKVEKHSSNNPYDDYSNGSLHRYTQQSPAEPEPQDKSPEDAAFTEELSRRIIR